MNNYTDRFGRKFDLNRAFKISITQTFSDAQPNHFNAPLARRSPIEIEGFVGSVSQGSGCNCDVIQVIPHCNGTHTETVGHIVAESVPISAVKIPVLMSALLITVEPTSQRESHDAYRPGLEAADRFISATAIQRALKPHSADDVDALIIRTLPNELEKLEKKYGDAEPPAFFSVQAMESIFELGVDHLLVDLPSVDRMHDEGQLTCHHIFWNVIEGRNELSSASQTGKTITELVFVHEALRDGVYLLNLQVADWQTDAAVSRPVLFPQVEASHA